MVDTLGQISDCPWVIARLGHSLFAIPSLHVMEMLVVPPLSPLPMAPEYIRGVMNLRDSVIMLIDLRKKLGYASMTQEIDDLVKLLEDREQDHKNWLSELEASVKEDREFKLATDPHKCKFGIWYDSYKPKNMLMEAHLKKFDEPHKRIHGLAEKACGMVKEGKKEDALNMIEKEHDGTLALMVELFTEAKKLLRETMREIALVMRYNGKTMGATVDSIESVEYLKEDSVEEIAGISIKGGDSVVSQTAKLARTDKVIMLIDTSKLFAEYAKLDPAMAEAGNIDVED